MKEKRYAKTPTVYQMEASECGAASLTMILGYYGRFMPLEQMRIETGVSRDGCNAKNILKAARKFGLEAKGYRKSLEDLFRLPVPCIIHWNFNHFVVWEGIKGKHCYINDPALGRRKLTKQDIDDCFTGVVLTFRKEDGFEKSRQKNTMWRFIRERVRSQIPSIAALVVTGLLLVVPGLIIPVFSQVFVDDILLGGNRDWVTALIAAMLGTMLFKAGLTYYRGMLLEKIQNKLILLSSYKFLSHLFRLPISFFDQRFAGDLAQRVTSNNNISVFLTSELASTVLNIMVALFYLILLILYDPLLTAIGVAAVVCNLFIMQKNAEMLADISMKQQQNQGRLMGMLLSGLTLTSTLKASGTENEFVSRLQGYYAKSISIEQQMGRRQELLNAIPQVSEQLTSMLILIMGGMSVIRGDMTAGMLVAYGALLSGFMAPINALAGFIQQIQLARADMNRVDDIMRYKEDDKFDTDIDKVGFQEKLLGNVTLRHVSFGYAILEKPFVEDFSFDLKSGSSVAFVGPSGSGKSTVAKVCSGLYDPWCGEILLDGVPIRNIPEAVLQTSISTVSQRIDIFSGTIRENLTMWNKFIQDRDVVKACQDACIHEFITSKPGAYEYRLQEGGGNLSGGQKQRLEIARALVTNPSILIMDEATSALDPLLEKQILDNIKRRGCTCIIVAHRLSAIRDCDEIIVMDRGRIVQRGTHEELVQTEGHYQRLIQTM
ncbi:MAG: NHLP family bacteriocin export ABC transporter peptidase/permease/ATPase subunit [Oscillospiraceae bacterium]|nr:NHLP family bacteriocin export ABC transporter peptidase/permease/ATPase subunit [Oscillospiraceae bacterium]